MAFAALDTSQNSRNFVDCMRTSGITAIGRYYTKRRTSSKILTADEARRLSEAGIRIWPVYQNRHREPVDFSSAKGKREAEDALDYAKNVINQPIGSGIYFSADFDASQATYDNAIRPHFEAIAAAFAVAGNPYRIGIYGSGAICKSLLEAGLVQLTWLSQSGGFRGTPEFKASRRWNILQALPVSGFCDFDDAVDPDTINPDMGDFGGFLLGHVAQPQLIASNSAEARGTPSRDIQGTLRKTRIAPDLLAVMEIKRSNSLEMAAMETSMFPVIIEFNRNFPGGISAARLTLLSAYKKARKTADKDASDAQDLAAISEGNRTARDDVELVKAFGPGDEVRVRKSLWTDNHVFANLSTAAIRRLSEWTLSVAGEDPKDPKGASKRLPLVYKIWCDHKITRCIYDSVRTIKCDAARITFAATGKGIVWAVADTGIDATHPHFRLLKTTKLEDGLLHKDFTQEHADDQDSETAALRDQDGHGTHVAGIIAGLTCRAQDNIPGVRSEITRITVKSHERASDDTTRPVDTEYTEPIVGLARDCKLVSLKVLANGDNGELSNLLAAIGYIQKCNDNGRSLKIHGVNLSLGYPFDPEWFAAGQSPVCVEVDRLVRSGVCVVVAAGNGGYGIVNTYSGGGERAAHVGTIADPGNADLAITVGSTHRDMPHAYGVSYFSAKGPTSDGRMKPDLVAPGERIVSCAVMNDTTGQATEALFREDSGTSMAAPHVSGAIAAFLSVRGEFKGRPERVKDIIVRGATDLKRRAEFQGTGLLDLLRALQSV